MKFQPFITYELPPRRITDNIDINAVYQSAAKDCNPSDANEFILLINQAASFRAKFRSLNLSLGDDYRQYYPVACRLARAMPWMHKSVSKLVSKGFSWSTSRSAQVTSVSPNLYLDMIGCVYNLAALQSQSAISQDQLKNKAQDLAKVCYFANLGQKIYETHAVSLASVGPECASHYFQFVENLFTAQCAEVQAILRSQNSDVTSLQAAFDQFVQLMTLAEKKYRTSLQAVAGLGNYVDADVKQFITKRLNTVQCCMLQVSAAKLSANNQSQALKDAQDALNLVQQADQMDFQSIQSMVMAIRSSGAITSPTASVYPAMNLDLSPKWKEWGLELVEPPKEELHMMSKDDFKIIQEVTQTVNIELTKEANQPRAGTDAAVTSKLAVDRIRNSISSFASGNVEPPEVSKLRTLANRPNLRTRLQNGLQFDIQLNSLVQVGRQTVSTLQNLVSTDAENVRKYGNHRWNSSMFSQSVNQRLSEVQKLIGVLSNQDTCINYLKRYNDVQFSPIFDIMGQIDKMKDIEAADTMNDKTELLTELNKMIMEFDQLYERETATKAQQLSEVEVMALLSQSNLNKKQVKDYAASVLQKLKSGPAEQPNLPMGSELMSRQQDIEQAFQKLSGNNQIATFNGKVSSYAGLITDLLNIVTTLESGEQFIEGQKLKQENERQAAVKLARVYTDQVQSQWGRFASDQTYVICLTPQ